jgi:uncharacterized glyoxalase superfamily protein PhnB
LKYDNPTRAIEFLYNAFGFEKFAVYPGADGSNVQAQLKLGSNFVMVGATTNGKGPMSTPQALAGGRNYSATDSEGYLWSFGR